MSWHQIIIFLSYFVFVKKKKDVVNVFLLLFYIVLVLAVNWKSSCIAYKCLDFVPLR